ncbi:coagulation factor V-like isoform X2 [Scomber scombrus]|uniref:Coagulation factor V-like isoform X2 n=1 Tax=Scomber scombrus TaxID=13677 RepID=A0AAV1MU64_SCOSC
MVTLTVSKPVCLTEGENSNEESDEAKSSEETATHAEPAQEPLQPEVTETNASNSEEEAEPTEAAALLPSADPEPSPGTLDSSVPSNPEDPQTSTDSVLQVTPADRSHTPLGIDIGQDMPNSDLATDTKVSLQPGLTGADTVIDVGDTNHPQVIPTTYQGFPQGATPPFPQHVRPTPRPFSPAHPMPIPIGTGVPVCFPFKLPTPEQDLPRGDSM